MNNRPDTLGRTRITQRNRALQGFNNNILCSAHFGAGVLGYSTSPSIATLTGGYSNLATPWHKIVFQQTLSSVRKKTRCLIRKRQGQGARSSENTESRQGGMSSFCCECNTEMDVFLQTLSTKNTKINTQAGQIIEFPDTKNRVQTHIQQPNNRCTKPINHIF